MRKFKLVVLISGICLSIGFLWGVRRLFPPSSLIPEPIRVSDGQTLPGTSPPGTSAAAVSPLPPLSPEAAAKLKILDQILLSRNDNDPRLDTEFKLLSDEMKEALRQKYRTMALEKRNERGTVIFLLGRNLSSETDFAFFCEVLREPPCYSLANCQGDPETAGKEDFDHEGGEEISLAYPQMVALHGLEKTPKELQEFSQKTIECAKDSRVNVVQKRASELLSPAKP